MRPYDVTDTDQFLSMESDNHPQEPDRWSILCHGGSVSLHAPNGKGWVEIPRAEFNVIVDWYVADQPATQEPADG